MQQTGMQEPDDGTVLLRTPALTSGTRTRETPPLRRTQKGQAGSVVLQVRAMATAERAAVDDGSRTMPDVPEGTKDNTGNRG